MHNPVDRWSLCVQQYDWRRAARDGVQVQFSKLLQRKTLYLNGDIASICAGRESKYVILADCYQQITWYYALRIYRKPSCGYPDNFCGRSLPWSLPYNKPFKRAELCLDNFPLICNVRMKNRVLATDIIMGIGPVAFREMIPQVFRIYETWGTLEKAYSATPTTPSVISTSCFYPRPVSWSWPAVYAGPSFYEIMSKFLFFAANALV